MIQRKTTKELLGESIHELAKRKTVDKITILEIVGNCGLSSATFYRHFQDKYELVAWTYLSQVEEIYRNWCAGTVSWQEGGLKMVTILTEDRSFYQNALLHTEGRNSFFWLTHSRCVELLSEHVAGRCEPSLTESLLFDVKFYMYGSSCLVTDWFMNALPYTAEDLVDYLYRAIPERVKKYMF